jgi:hypothetical protein
MACASRSRGCAVVTSEAINTRADAAIGLGGPMKTYSIELQRVKSMSNQHGLIQARIDAVIQAQTPKRSDADDGSAEPLSVLSFNEDTARVLVSLLKAQIAEFDKRKARSRF